MNNYLYKFLREILASFTETVIHLLARSTMHLEEVVTRGIRNTAYCIAELVSTAAVISSHCWMVCKLIFVRERTSGFKDSQLI